MLDLSYTYEKVSLSRRASQTCKLTQTLGKHALALRCLLAAKSLGASISTTHSQILRLSNALTTLPTALPVSIATAIQHSLDPLLPSKPTKTADLVTFNDAFLAANETDPASVLAAWDVRVALDDNSKSHAVDALAATVKIDSATLDSTRVAVGLCRDWGVDSAKVVQAAKGRWPEASMFRAGRA